MSVHGIQALLFDFDGLLVDSETAGLRSWQELYRRYGCELDLRHWLEEIRAGRGPCMPREQLEEALGRRPDWEALERVRQARRDDLLVHRPGVDRVLAEAGRLGLASGIVSNAPDWWLERQMARTGLARDRFAVVITRDLSRRSKPSPDAYRAALGALRIHPRRAVAFEDSPVGIAAALAAGIACVAVPNDVTRFLPLPATVVLPALDSVPLTSLLELVTSRRRSAA
jgi:HAD superfamily hydrolase (TIGR01509 family)